jgi:hypothetical protein
MIRDEFRLFDIFIQVKQHLARSSTWLGDHHSIVIYHGRVRFVFTDLVIGKCFSWMDFEFYFMKLKMVLIRLFYPNDFLLSK